MKPVNCVYVYKVIECRFIRDQVIMYTFIRDQLIVCLYVCEKCIVYRNIWDKLKYISLYGFTKLCWAPYIALVHDAWFYMTLINDV
jgi:hypothetical protein